MPRSRASTTSLDRRTVLRGIGASTLGTVGIGSRRARSEGTGPSVRYVAAGYRDPLSGEFTETTETGGNQTVDVGLSVSGVANTYLYTLAFLREGGGLQSLIYGTREPESTTDEFIHLGVPLVNWPTDSYDLVATVTDFDRTLSDVGGPYAFQVG